MENSAAASDEPQKKRPHLNSVFSSPTMARHLKISSDNKDVDAAVLQHQNQKLVQQLDAQKHKLHDLEAKMKELRDKQASYDDFLVTLNRIWNQLDDDLIILGVHSMADQISLQSLDHQDYSGGSIPSCPAEEIFLCRVLKTNAIPGNANDVSIVNIREALDLRHSSTLELMKSLENAIDAQRIKTENLAHLLEGKTSAEDGIIILSKIDDMMKEEANYLHQVIDVLHLKHKAYADAIEACNQRQSADQSELKRLEGELEESMTELEDSRRKLVTLKMQKDVACGVQETISSAVNGSMSPEKHTDRTKGVRELKESIEEAKILKEDRLSELHDAQEDNQHLSKQLQDLQNELKDDRYVHSSRAYTLCNDQLHHWNSEAERYKALADSLQADRSFIGRREKELVLKAEAVDAAKKAVDNSESRIEELEHRMHRYIIEKNELEIKMEEAIQDSGRKDIKEEFQIMGSALSKEIGMMEAQVNRWKETAQEAVSLREERRSLETSLERKVIEHKDLIGKCAHQTGEIRTLKELAEKMQRDKQELEIILEMIGQQIYDNRDISEIRESERRAHSQAEILRAALNEHDLELRVKAANEAESACQQRLSAAEAEIAELRAELDASDRGVLELTEAIKIKEGEAETYISEIETIGQAYEDMQTQNQHLLQQLAERDDYNIKLVSESVKIKQEQSLLLSRKQVSTAQLQQSKTSLESLKMRITQSEDQMKVHITEALSYTQEDRHLALLLETTKRESGDAEKELKGLSTAFGQAPYPNGETFFHAPAGRFSDGRLLIDFIAEGLDLPYLSAFLDSIGSNFSHGANFATAGSTIRPQNTTMAQSGYSPISLDVQGVQFSDFHTRSQIIRQKGNVFGQLLPNEEDFSQALYTFDIGQNDLTAGYKLNMSTDQVKAYVPDLLSQLSNVIKKVYAKGGRSFWIHNTGPVGCLPYVMDRFMTTAAQIDKYGCANPFNEVSKYFNLLLKKTVVQLRKELPLAAFTYVDVYSVKYSLIGHAKKLGFENPFLACCGHGGKYNYNRFIKCGSKRVVNGKEIVIASSCKDPSVRVNWDGTHFTEAANKWIFDQIVNGSFSDPPIPLSLACNRVNH